jgi:endonuclease/exonuclease/phosphatase family metal-dependent hydrolase
MFTPVTNALNSMKLSSTGYKKTPTQTSGGLKNGQTLRLLSYNIQTGIATRRFHHYLTHSWKHVLPHSERIENLNRIARMIHEYDVVGLQEVDGGSLRSGFINQTEYLAVRASFPYWYDQTNRNLGKIAQHSTGLLSRFPTAEITEHKLPGFIPGRGALTVEFKMAGDPLILVILHLALSQRARKRQLEFVSELLSDYKHAVVMGDMNCQPDSNEMKFLMENSQLVEPASALPTFPSWRPFKNIDHILVSPTLTVEEVKVLNYPLSDHLPISMTVRLPAKGIFG